MGFRKFVVDDEQVIASSLAAILKLQGFEARFFVNPFEALEAFESTPPDLLISDVMMPGMTGVELAMKLKETCSDCKVLLFSGQAKTVGLLETARCRGHEFLLINKANTPFRPYRPRQTITCQQLSIKRKLCKVRSICLM